MTSVETMRPSMTKPLDFLLPSLPLEAGPLWQPGGRWVMRSPFFLMDRFCVLLLAGEDAGRALAAEAQRWLRGATTAELIDAID